MTFYFAIHYHMSRFLETVTKDDLNLYNQILNWFQVNKNAKGIISMNGNFIQSQLWSDETLLKNISKLGYSNQIDFSFSMFSDLFPSSLPYEKYFLDMQIKSGIKAFETVFKESIIQGYYPPLSIWDKRSIGSLKETDIKYIILDWNIINNSIFDEVKLEPSAKLLRPFKVKNSELHILPSFNLRSTFRIFPEVYKDYLKSGELTRLVSFATKAAQFSERENIDLFAILTLDFNNLRFPSFHSEFDFDNFFEESTILTEQPFSLIRPSDIISKFNLIEEIELKDNVLPLELQFTEGYNQSGLMTPCCQFYTQLFNDQTDKLLKLAEQTQSLQEPLRKRILNLISVAWNWLIIAQHNLCFITYSEPIKGVDISRMASIWNSARYIDLIYL
ncbi:MAG: hypothetical protein ACXABK_06245, partial [Candidatus Heimdallarchaeaceae archaeon]